MAQITDARAWCNNQVAYLAWQTDGKIQDCLGFMITRVHLNDDGTEAGRRILPSWAAFKTQSNPDWEEQDTSVWPIQKFTWRDLTLRQSRNTLDVRDKPSFSVRYEIVPVGKSGPGSNPVPPSPTAQPGKYKGAPIPLFFCGTPKSTNTVTVSTQVVSANGKPIVTAGFTNGILSTQNLRKQLKTPAGKAPTKNDLKNHIQTAKPDPIRSFLTADALPLIRGFMDRAKAENCDLYLALYELNDPELIAHIEANAERVHLILSTAGSTKPPKGSGKKATWDTTNKESRKRLRSKVAEFHDRMFNNSGHIGHNKFAVLVDRASKKAKAVLAGSTNWTFTGLCTQSNNVILLDVPEVAAAYLEYWQRLKDDKLPQPKGTSAAQLSAPNNNKQGQVLRSKDTKPNDATLAVDGKTSVELWYSPNTKSATKTKTSATPPDLAVAFDLMKKAKDAIFFLTFMPSVAGDQSIIKQSIDVATGRPDLLVLGAISDGKALPGYDATPAAKKTRPAKSGKASKRSKPKRAAKKAAKKSRKTAKKKAGRRGAKTRTMAMAARASVKKSAKKKSGASRKSGPPQPKRAIYTNPKARKVLMVRAAAINVFDLIGNWQLEMLKYGQAMIHDKIVVIDPLSDDCVVITGSHNLGYKASYANDENMLIIRHNKALATAYAVHILDVYDHYKFRAILEQQALERATKPGAQKPPIGQGILELDGSWQDGYFDGTKGQEREYFLGAAKG